MPPEWARRLRIPGAVAAMLAALIAFPGLPGWVDEDRIRGMVAQAGPWGPVVIVALMTVAVVVSPVPSAPVALAAGAAYGHTMGTLYVLVGAESGALIAFGLARGLGREALRRRFGNRLDRVRMLGSQGLLMWLVFVSRLMPFVSFDLISYAAGLSPLGFWRFALATLAGILPASFLLAHLGGEMMRAGGTSSSWLTLWLVLGLGLVTGLPLLRALWTGRKDTASDSGKAG